MLDLLQEALESVQVSTALTCPPYPTITSIRLLPSFACRLGLDL